VRNAIGAGGFRLDQPFAPQLVEDGEVAVREDVTIAREAQHLSDPASTVVQSTNTAALSERAHDKLHPDEIRVVVSEPDQAGTSGGFHNLEHRA
jgi:hypothetical protein